jgi:iron complex transport system substrate-binding protein
VGKALGSEGAAEQLIAHIQNEMSETDEKLPPLVDHPEVLCLEWLDPPMTAGNWMPQLVHRAGGRNLLSEAGKPSSTIAWEEIRRVQPELLLILPCGFDIARSKKEMDVLTGQPGWKEIPAVRQGRVFIVDGNQYFNRPGPRLLDSFYILTELFHPEIFPPRYEGKAWIPFSA